MHDIHIGILAAGLPRMMQPELHVKCITRFLRFFAESSNRKQRCFSNRRSVHQDFAQRTYHGTTFIMLHVQFCCIGAILPELGALDPSVAVDHIHILDDAEPMHQTSPGSVVSATSLGLAKERRDVFPELLVPLSRPILFTCRSSHLSKFQPIRKVIQLFLFVTTVRRTRISRVPQ